MYRVTIMVGKMGWVDLDSVYSINLARQLVEILNLSQLNALTI